jgi:hypothetical protein
MQLAPVDVKCVVLEEIAHAANLPMAPDHQQASAPPQIQKNKVPVREM